jgi:hypothetical protein
MLLKDTILRLYVRRQGLVIFREYHSANSLSFSFNRLKSAGAELEFCLRDSSTGDSVDDSAYGNSITLNDQETFISDLYDQLKEQRITAELIHAESGRFMKNCI